jgi:hypothetical protein
VGNSNQVTICNISHTVACCTYLFIHFIAAANAADQNIINQKMSSNRMNFDLSKINHHHLIYHCADSHKYYGFILCSWCTNCKNCNFSISLYIFISVMYCTSIKKRHTTVWINHDFNEFNQHYICKIYIKFGAKYLWYNLKLENPMLSISLYFLSKLLTYMSDKKERLHAFKNNEWIAHTVHINLCRTFSRCTTYAICHYMTQSIICHCP